MAVPSTPASSTIQWRYDTETSWVLRLIAHGFIAGIGSPLILSLGVALISLPEVLPHLGIEMIVFIVLLFLIGGPFSLLYLWPLLTDSDQRPALTAFTWEEGTIPWTKRSFLLALLGGTGLLAGLLAVNMPFDIIFAIIVMALCSPVVVTLFTSIGAIEDAHLKCNGHRVPLHQITRVRSVQVGNAVIYWLSFARGTGILAPRLLTVPVETSAHVQTALTEGTTLTPERSQSNRLVQVIVSVMGLLFIAVAIVGSMKIAEPAIRLYFSGVIGGIGLLLCLAGWRGI